MILFGGQSCLKTFLGGFKIQNSISKVEKCQNILRITKLENVEKIHRDHVLEAQMISIHYMAVLFCSTHSLDIVLCCKILFGLHTRRQHLHSKVEKLYIQLHQPKVKTYADIFRLLNVNVGFYSKAI